MHKSWNSKIMLYIYIFILFKLRKQPLPDSEWRRRWRVQRIGGVVGAVLRTRVFPLDGRNRQYAARVRIIVGNTANTVNAVPEKGSGGNVRFLLVYHPAKRPHEHVRATGIRSQIQPANAFPARHSQWNAGETNWASEQRQPKVQGSQGNRTIIVVAVNAQKFRGLMFRRRKKQGQF